MFGEFSVAVIRQSEAHRIAADAIALDLGDLNRQGEAFIARAKGEANKILAAAHAERARIMRGIEEEARKKGFEQGLKEGREQGRKEGHAAALVETKAQLAKVDEAWTQALAKFEQTRASMLQDAREDVLALTLKLTNRVVKRAITLDPTLIQDQLSAVLAAIARPSALQIAINPADESLAREALQTLSQRITSAQHAAINVDTKLPRGSCVVRTPAGGEVDATIATQLTRIAEALLPINKHSQLQDAPSSTTRVQNEGDNPNSV